MTRLRTGNRRRLRADRYEPLCCPKHGKPFRGDGWHAEGVGRFRCYAPHCRQRRYWTEAGGLHRDPPEASA